MQFCSVQRHRPFHLIFTNNRQCPLVVKHSEWRRRRDSSSDTAGGSSTNGQYAPPLVAFTFFGLFGFEDWKKLDDDPLKGKIKLAMLHRKYGRFEEAIGVLEEAMKEAEQMGNPKIVTRVYDEMANTYYEADELDKADALFRKVVHRLITIHRKTESSPEFIGISLKLSDIFAREGDPDSADIGYKHCLSKQFQESDKALAKYHIEHGGHFEVKVPVEEVGLDYTEPMALLGMCLHEYALFLVDFYAEQRLDEAEEYVKEALKISNKIYGPNSYHAVNIINSFAAKCVLKNKFETARRFLEIGLDRILFVPECETIACSYYCCYAEALFHTGDYEAAVDYSNRAQQIGRDNPDPAVRSYVKKFAQQIQRDANRMQRNGANNGEGEKNRRIRLWPF